MDIPDSDVIERVLAGDADAFAVLVERHRPGLFRVIALMIGDQDEAESLAQETLTRAYSQLASFQANLSFPAWLRGIAVNLCRNHLRDRVRHARPVDPEQLRDVAALAGRRQGVLSGILRQEIGECALNAIGELPIPLREAFVLHYVEGLDYAEMAEITGQSAGTLRTRAHRARNLLRGNLGSVVDTWMRQASDRS